MPNPEYLRERDTGDVYQRVHGNTYQRISMGGGGCSLGCLGLLVLALCGPIFYLGVSFENYQKYHQFMYSYTDAMTAEVATADTPYHFKAIAIAAKRSGDASIVSNPTDMPEEEPSGIRLGLGGALTFDVYEPEDGNYKLTIDGKGSEYYTIGVFVKGKQQIKVDVDFSSFVIEGSNAYPTIHLQNGHNTIKLLAEKNLCYENSGCSTLWIGDIVIDKY